MRTLILGAVLVFFSLGCNGSTSTTAPVQSTSQKEHSVKVRAPGVNVDIDSQEKKKVNVDIHPDR